MAAGGNKGERSLTILEGSQTKKFADGTEFENVHMLTLDPLSHDCVALHMFVHYLCTLFLQLSFLYVGKKNLGTPVSKS